MVLRKFVSECIEADVVEAKDKLAAVLQDFGSGASVAHATMTNKQANELKDSISMAT